MDNIVKSQIELMIHVNDLVMSSFHTTILGAFIVSDDVWHLVRSANIGTHLR